MRRSSVAQASLKRRSSVAQALLKCCSSLSNTVCVRFLSLTFHLRPQLALLASVAGALPVVFLEGRGTPVLVTAARCMCAAILAFDTVPAFDAQ